MHANPTRSDVTALRAQCLRLSEWLQHADPDDPQRAVGAWRLRMLRDRLRRQGGRLSNPAWLNEALTVSWGEIEDRVPPIATLLANGRVRAKPFGCGVWGCVMPTVQPGIVLKITNDPSEAQFVATVLRNKAMQHPGIVRYYDMVKLPVRYENMAVYALWREEAFDVGEVVPEHIVTRDDRELETFAQRLSAFQRYADIFATMKKRRPRDVEQAHALADLVLEYKLVYLDGGDVLFRDVRKHPALRMATLLQVCRVYAEMIAHGSRGQLVGRALADFMHEGILLADVHEGNIGNAKRHGRKVLVVTDPGVAVPLSQHMAQVMKKAAA